MHISQAFTWKGEINRRDYLIWGTLLFALKYNLDRLTAIYFGRSWDFMDYVVQANNLSVVELLEDDRLFYFALLLQSLPFIWFGTVLCVKRLRSAKIRPWLVIFFFIPFLNFVLFVLLAAVPEKEKNPTASKADFWTRFLPKNKYGSAAMALGLVSIIALILSLFFINYLEEYGWSLFVGIPFFLGFNSVLIHGQGRGISYLEALGVMLASVLLFNLVIFILAMEGLICLAMAFPIMLLVGAIGASIAYAVLENDRSASLQVVAAPLVTIFLFGLLEYDTEVNPPLIPVRTAVIVKAEKQVIWDELVAFSRIDEPSEWLFETGIAYPTHAVIKGTGVGAVRHCNFTTGSFIEPITVWDEPNLLRFSVEAQPPPMVEWSWYNDLEIEHLDGYFKSEKGQFLLTSLPDGSTKLEGTTWYRHDIWPTFYWHLWSEFILHEIHLRVLKHIKKEAEGKG